MTKVKSYALKTFVAMSALGLLAMMGIGLYSAFDATFVSEDDIALGVLITGVCLLVTFVLFIPDKNDLV